uniref:Peptidase M41 domain-containing protein n=1 Tax=Meloidogyne javanica TaxID=6303 RepID=A0A915LNU0_MELJA
MFSTLDILWLGLLIIGLFLTLSGLFGLFLGLFFGLIWFLDVLTSKKANSKKEEYANLDLEANKINFKDDFNEETKIEKTQVEEVNEVQETQEDEDSHEEETFDYDSFKFELDLDDIDLLAATQESMLEDEFLLECRYEQKGPPNALLSSKQKKRLAIHESGHTFIAFLLEIDVKKVTLKSEGELLGHTLLNFATNQISVDTDKDNFMTVILGGYAAEMMILNKPSTLSRGDLAVLSNVVLGKDATFALSGNPSLYMSKDPSNELKKKRDDIIISDVDKCTERAKQLVKQNKDAISELSTYLLDNEEILHDELYTKLWELKKKYKKE